MSLEASGISSATAKAIQDITNDVFNPFDLRSAWVPSLVFAGMADGDEEEGNEGDDGDGTGDGDDGDGSDGSTSGTSGTDIKDPEKKRLSDEAARYRNEAKEAKRQLQELNAWKQEQENKGKTEQERLESELNQFKSKVEQLEPVVKEQAVRLAFFESGAAAKFRNPKTALRLLDLKDVEVDEDGEVDSDAIGKLAEQLLKDEPYLAASSQEATDDDDDLPESGRPLNGKRRKDADANLENLKKKFPALRR